MIAIRGAIRVDRNERDEIFRRTGRLLREIRDRNGLEEDDVVSAFFTMTPDLDADFPARAAREMGWTDTAMLGARESAVPGAMDRMVRVLVHAEAPGPARHVYMGDAAGLRPDLAEEDDGVEAPGGSRGAAAGEAAPTARSGGAGGGGGLGDPPHHGTLLVVGLGLVGGSAALALQGTRLFETVLGHDVDEADARAALRAGAVDELISSPGEGLGRADAVLLAVPVSTLPEWMERWGPELRSGTVVLDTGSTKETVVRAMEGLPERVEAVGGHPMAGSERSGFGAATADLFRGAPWALVETPRTGERARELATGLVQAVGARPLWTDAADHDRAVASTSHLPYLVSAALALHLEERSGEGSTTNLVGPGARGMLRLAGSAPSMMSGILASNRNAVRAEVEGYLAHLEGLFRELEAALDGEADPGRGVRGVPRDEGGASERRNGDGEADGREGGGAAAECEAILRRVLRARRRLRDRSGAARALEREGPRPGGKVRGDDAGGDGSGAAPRSA